MEKSGFLKKIRFYLSFFFNGYDCENIVNDYEEWIENEIQNGKSQEDVIAKLSSPIYTVSLIVNSISIKKSLLYLQGSMTRIMFYIFLGSILNICVFRECSKYGKDSFVCALVINIIMFSIGYYLFEHKEKYVKRKKMNYLVVNLLAIAVIIAMQIFLLLPISGRVLENILNVILVLITVYLILFIYKKRVASNKSYFLGVFNTVGMISIGLYTKSQFHVLYSSYYEIGNLLVKSVCLLLEITVLNILIMLLMNKEKCKEYEFTA